MVNYESIFQTSKCFPLDIKFLLENSGDQGVSQFLQTFVNLLIILDFSGKSLKPTGEINYS